MAGATWYTVYRGTTATSITTQVSPAGRRRGHLVHRQRLRRTARRTTTRSAPIAGGAESANSLVVQSDARSRVRARPATRSCSRTAIPGNTPLERRATRRRSRQAASRASPPRQSINSGESVDLKVNSDDGATFRIEIYRTGYYGGAGARLFSVITGRARARAQPALHRRRRTPASSTARTGRRRATLTTTTRRGRRASTCSASSARTPARTTRSCSSCATTARTSQLVYGVAFATFEAYNNYGGKSLYDFNSIGQHDRRRHAARGEGLVRPAVRAAAVGSARLVHAHARRRRSTGSSSRATTSSYVSNTDLGTKPSRARWAYKAYISPAHDEYCVRRHAHALMTRRAMRASSLFFSGSQRGLLEDPLRERPERRSRTGSRSVTRSTQSGGPDPSGIPTGTWRDPNGANQPENALDRRRCTSATTTTTTSRSSSAPSQGADRVYRYTGARRPGAPARRRRSARTWSAGNGMPASQTASSRRASRRLRRSPVTGELIQNNGAQLQSRAARRRRTIDEVHRAERRARLHHRDEPLEPRARAQRRRRRRAGHAHPAGHDERPRRHGRAARRRLRRDIVLDARGIDRPAAPTDVDGDDERHRQRRRSPGTPVPGADGLQRLPLARARDDGQPLGALATARSITGHELHGHRAQLGDRLLLRRHRRAWTASSRCRRTRRRDDGRVAPASRRGSTSGGDRRLHVVDRRGLPRRRVLHRRAHVQSRQRADLGHERPGALPERALGHLQLRDPGRERARTTSGSTSSSSTTARSVPGGSGQARLRHGHRRHGRPAPISPNIDVYAAVGTNTALVRTVPNVTMTTACSTSDRSTGRPTTPSSQRSR